MLVTVLIAFGFGNLALLGWLAAAAAPLLIHLWSRHRHREAPWAAMQFLLAALRKNARRMQLQQWLLLALRTLIIALIMLAAAEPYGEQILAGAGGGISHKVIVIDGSYSMAFEEDGISRFTRAKQLATNLVRESRPADIFTVILMAEPARTLVDRRQVDRGAVAAEIDRLSQIDTGADIAATIDLVDIALNDPGLRSPPDRREVYFFTDLQNVTWDKASGQLQSLQKDAVITLVNVARDDSSNLAVTSFMPKNVLVTVGREAAFEVTLHQFGPQPRSKCQVELLVDGSPASEQTIDVPAGGDAAVRFTYRFRSPGYHSIAVRADGDSLSVDNSRRLVVPVREEVRVLCVAGREGAARYVAQALMPNPAGESPIRPLIVAESDLADINLSDFDAVFVCNVGQLTQTEAERLGRFAAEGGGVIFFLGDRVSPESYNNFAVGAAPLLPARIGELVGDPQVGLDPLEYRHPIVAPFRGRERAGLLTTPINRYFRLEIDANRPGTEVAVKSKGGDPFIVARQLGRGRTAVVATDGSLSSVDKTTGEPWTQWPTWPSFLPIVRELLSYSTAGQRADWQQLVGAPLSGPVTGAAAKANSTAPTITRPDGRTAAVSLQVNGTQWAYADTDLSGVYSIGSSSPETERPFAVNVDTKESDLAKLNVTELPAGVNVREHALRPSDDSATAGVTQSTWSESLLVLVFGLLFVESFLAWSFGRGAA